MSEINPTTDGKYVVFYDLPSEHRSIFEQNERAIKQVQNCRWKCGELLHSLGLECTQSTILVAPMHNLDIVVDGQVREYGILSVKAKVLEKYREVQTWLIEQGNIPNAELNPIIEIVELVGDTQVGQMTRLVTHTLNQRVDQAIERINDLINTLDAGELERRQIRRLHYRLPDEISEWHTVQQMATAYGIDTHNVSALIELINEARSRV